MKFFYESRVENKELEVFENQTAFGKHYHCGLEINYCLTDGMEFSLNEQRLVLNKGDVLFIDSFDIHSNGDGHIVCLVIPEMFLGNYRLVKKNLSIKKPYFTDTDKKIFNLIQDLRNSKYFSFLKNMGYVNLILGEVLDKTLLNNDDKKVNEHALTEILEYIEKNFNNKITLEDISNAIGYSKSHISHTLSTHLQMDFRTYLNRLRLAKFINITSSENKIYINAKECGFDSIKTFYRSFKEEFGCSPSQYFKMKGTDGK